MAERQPPTPDLSRPIAEIGHREAKLAAVLLAADVVALLHEPRRTLHRMTERRAATDYAAVVLVAAAVRELVARDQEAARKSGKWQDKSAGDELVMARNRLSLLVSRCYPNG